MHYGCRRGSTVSRTRNSCYIHVRIARLAVLGTALPVNTTFRDKFSKATSLNRLFQVRIRCSIHKSILFIHIWIWNCILMYTIIPYIPCANLSTYVLLYLAIQYCKLTSLFSKFSKKNLPFSSSNLQY